MPFQIRLTKNVRAEEIEFILLFKHKNSAHLFNVITRRFKEENICSVIFESSSCLFHLIILRVYITCDIHLNSILTLSYWISGL